MREDGTPIPDNLSGEIVERIIRLDSALLYLVTGALSFVADREPLEQTGTLTVDSTREALSQMLWDYLTGEPMPQYIVGEYKMLSFKPAPDGWIQCNGQIVLQADYPELYAVIGGNFNTGGEAGNEFRIPLFDTRSPVGSPVGAVQPVSHYGEDEHTLTVAELPSHSHRQTGLTNSQVLVEYTGVTGGNFRGAGGVGSNGTQPSLTLSVGGNTPFDLYHPVQEVNICIYAGGV